MAKGDSDYDDEYDEVGHHGYSNDRDPGLPSPSEDIRARYESYQNKIPTHADVHSREALQRRLELWRQRYSEDVNGLDMDIQQLGREKRPPGPFDPSHRPPRSVHSFVDENDEDFREFYPHDQEHSQFKRGCYTRRFKVVDCEPNYSILFGIVSARNSYDTDPARNTSFYGWSTQATVYRAGERAQTDREYQERLVTGNVITLEINCDEKYICLSNRATGTRYELNVDTKRCPLPWRLNIQMSRSGR